ncbi:MAG: MMPL family transporter [Planctomycetales bacterium]
MQSRVSGTTIGLTGIPVLECDEMRSSEQAMMLESIVSYTGVSLLLIFGFRGFRHPFLAMLMLGIGMTCAFGFATLAVGHLNILSVSFVAIVVGLGIDYAILFLSRYMEVRRGGTAVQPAVVETSRQVGPGILTAAATTSLAFLCAVFTDFLGVSELGLIAGGGIILCAVAALVFMPAMVALMDRKAKPKQLPTPFQVAWLRETIWKKPLPVVLGSLGVVIWVGMYGERVKYDYNLMNLQSQSLESVRLQKTIAEKSDSRLLYAVSMCNSPEEALQLKKKFEALPTVHHVDEIASMLPAHPAEQTQLMVQGIQVLLSRLPKGLPQYGPVDPKLVGQRMDELYQTLDAMKRQLPAAQPLHQALDRFLDKLDGMTFEKQVALLTEFQTRIAADLITRLRMLASVSHPEPVGVADLPAGLATRFVGKQGQWLLQIHPKEQLWEVEPLRKFTAEVRSVDADVTGTPLQNLEALQQIRRGYETVAVYALLACFLVLLVDFVKGRDAVLALSVPLAGVAILIASALWWGHQLVASQLALAYVLMTLTLVAVLDLRNFCHIFLAMMPPLVGGAFTLGILGLMHVDLNPANLIILPLILGIGVDNGVHVLHDFRHQTGRYQCSPSLVNALFLTSFANMAGFASMILAAHQGLKSIGLVLTIGVGSCLFVSVVLLPSILTLMSARREDAHSEAESDQEGQGRNFHVYLPEQSHAA